MCQDQIDRITSRHIAKLLTRLGDTIAPVQEAEIKRQMRFLADDIKQVNTEVISGQSREQETGNR